MPVEPPVLVVVLPPVLLLVLPPVVLEVVLPPVLVVVLPLLVVVWVEGLYTTLCVVFMHESVSIDTVAKKRIFLNIVVAHLML